MDYYKGTIPIIDDSPEGRAYAMPKKIDGTKIGYGYVPRDYKVYPKEMFDPPSSLQLVPESEMDARFDEQEEQESSLEHKYLSGPNGTPAFTCLDQNGDGYCWIYSNGHALMLKRLAQNQKVVRLNPHSSGAIIKSGRDEGGWCGLGARFIKDIGMAEEGDGPGQWPLHSRSLRNDTPACRALMAKYRTVEDYVDLTRDVYDQNLSEAVLRTLGFINVPCPTDYNWQSHSVCRLRTVRIERGSWGTLILNSWRGWGRHGLGVYRGSQARADGAVALRQATAA